MKQYLDQQQTAKLIELGFEKPSQSFYQNGVTWIQCEGNYSIGELIEVLDTIPNNMWNFTRTSTQVIKVEINVFPTTKNDKHLYKISYNKELIDSLFDMIVLLKEEGVI